MQLPFRTLLYRYLCFGWLFQDMRLHGSLFEHAAARRHNQEQSRWLPLYMLRYAVLGAGLVALGAAAESLSPVLSALFYIPGTMSVPMLAVVGVAWAALRFRH
ncbi:hypothetical protein [Aquabacterium sp.]|uniref:hypothetical protein n=1 Tax=Aquabacterium sp. TaxID=1872578 RepID=UPI002C5E0191|nr:hypothetical protein [Aquabacterium sp.]HSW07463.1 hypothetical protein [Aquabacterium sp.]